MSQAERVGASRETIDAVENPVLVPCVALALSRVARTSVQSLFFLEDE